MDNTKNTLTAKKERWQCREWFWLCLVLYGVILVMLAMFFNYNLKLDARTVSLEKKNGKEQKQIDDLKEEIKRLEEIIRKRGGN